MNDDENVVIENMNLPMFTEPLNNSNNIMNEDVSLFSFHEEEDTHADLNKTHDELSLHSDVTPSIDNASIGDDTDTPKFNIPWDIFQMKLSASLLSSMYFC